MKHNSIKKSIIIIMITTLLLTCVSSLAYTVVVQDFELNGRDQIYLTPDYVINSQPDQSTGNYYITYKYSETVDFYIRENGRYKYLNGLYMWAITVDMPAAYTIKAVDFQVEPIYNSDFTSTGINRMGFWNKCFFIATFTNFYTNNSYYTGCKYDVYITIQATQTQAVPAPTINCNVSISDVAGGVEYTDYPQTSKGLAGIIGASVMQAINNSDANLNLEALLIYAASQEDLLEDVLAELQTNNVNLSNIYSHLIHSQYPQLQTIISKLQEIIDKGSNDTQAANELSLAAQQMENAAAAMDVSKPNIAAVIPETLLAADAAQAQSDIFAWLQNSYILQILVACFTIALIGFVLYGKSG